MSRVRRLSVLVVESDAGRSLEIAGLLRDLGVRDVVRVHNLAVALEWLKGRALDVLICAERLDDGSGPALVEAARQVSPATRSLVLPEDQGRGPSSGGGFGRLELSAWGVLLQVFLNGAVAPRGGFWCDVPDLSLCDVLQLYHQLRRSVTVLLSGPIAGYVRLEAGELVDAATENLVGIPALLRLLEAQAGLLRTDLSKLDSKRTISAPFQRVILDAVEQIDKRQHAARRESGVVLARSATGSKSGNGSKSSIDLKSGIEVKRAVEVQGAIDVKRASQGTSAVEVQGGTDVKRAFQATSAVEVQSGTDVERASQVTNADEVQSGTDVERASQVTNADEVQSGSDVERAIQATSAVELTSIVELQHALEPDPLLFEPLPAGPITAARPKYSRPSPVVIAASALALMVLIFALGIYFAKRSERLRVEESSMGTAYVGGCQPRPFATS